jgi:S1-C subfamily serine protease
VNLIDIIVIALLIGALVVGARVGFFAGLGGLAGLFLGGLATPWVVPLVNDAVTNREWRGTAVLVAAIGLLAVGAALGTTVGRAIRHGADRIKLKAVERLLGGALGVLVTALALSAAGTAIGTAGIPGVSSSVASSSVLRAIDRATPPALASAFAEFRSVVLDDTIPTIGGLVDPGQDVPEPTVDPGSGALAAASGSVARISGVAYACGVSSTGSGFVVAEDRIVTNAHVVAGVESVVVELPNEPARDGVVVYFDPADDLAVIAVDVDAAALPVVDPLAEGDSGAVQGYPHGGPFETEPASVVSVGTITAQDIYGGGGSDREIYALAAEVVPGNSGGPLLTPEGEVAGVVFARDEARAEIGYAMTTTELGPVLDGMGGFDAPVATGECTA